MKMHRIVVLALIGALTWAPHAEAKGRTASTSSWWNVGDPLPTGDGAPETLPADAAICGIATTVDLFAGQSTDVGSVTVANDGATLYVTATVTPAYQLGTVHLWVGVDLLDVPSTGSGTPIPGQFPFQVDATGQQTVTFTLGLGTDVLPVACGSDLLIVLHAEVAAVDAVPDASGEIPHETAFGGDTPGGGPRWWYSFAHTVQCCDGGGGGGSFQTAFAKGGWIWTTDKKSNPEKLPSLKLTKNRWGWAIQLPAVTQATTFTYDVWAGCGLNDTRRGTLVGEATIVWDGNEVEIVCDLFPGYTMSEMHVYAGDLAPTTIAPGQYGYTEGFDPYAGSASVTLPVDDVGGNGVWVVVHAVVFGSF